MGWVGVVNVYEGVGGGIGGGYHLIVFVLFLRFCILLSNVLSPFILAARS